MKNPWLQFTRWPYEDEFDHFELMASDGRYCAAQEFYAAPEDVAEFASCLKTFPRSRSDEASLQVGERNPTSAHWVSLRVYVCNSSGHAAISMDVSNNSDEPYRAEARFTIVCEPASVNRLGEQVSAWLKGSERQVRVDLTAA